MNPIITWNRRPIGAEWDGKQLIYECPFCHNGVTLNAESFTVTEEHQQINTLMPIQCPWETCDALFDIIHNCVVEVGFYDMGGFELKENGINQMILCKLQRIRNERFRR